jgi:hypothetical protein
MSAPAAPAPTATATAPGTAVDGPVVGRVDGEVSVGFESRTSWGALVLVVAAVLSFTMFVYRGSAPLPTDPLGVVGTLIAAVVMLVGLLLLCAICFGIAPGMLRPGGRGSTAQGAHGPASTRVPVRRFRVRSVTGELVSCVQAGDLLDEEIRHGDLVMVRGRRGRDGRLWVRHAEVREAPAGPTLRVVRTRRGARGAGSVIDRVYLVLGVALLVRTGIDVLRMVV